MSIKLWLLVILTLTLFVIVMRQLTKEWQRLRREEKLFNEGHSYPKYKEVIQTLTEKYGFKYTGLGDNYEECFYKDGEKPERIFIHKMFCAYSMDSNDSLKGYENRLHDITFHSKYGSEDSQNVALSRLYTYLDKHSIKHTA